MPNNRLILVQEVDTGFYRIIELFPTSDGMRSRACSFRCYELDKANIEMTRRQNIIDGVENE